MEGCDLGLGHIGFGKKRYSRELAKELSQSQPQLSDHGFLKPAYSDQRFLGTQFSEFSEPEETQDETGSQF